MTDIHFAEAKSFRLDPLSDEMRVRQIKMALIRLGFYRPNPNIGFNGERDAQFNDALHAFQRRATIFFDDVDVEPGSTTERIINRDLAAIDKGAVYIWRTAGDNKVRHEHAQRQGKRFRWDDLADGEHPGEDYNCRCWAEPVVAPYHPWIEWVQKRQIERQGQSGVYPDAIDPVEIGPAEIIAGGMILKSAIKAAVPPTAALLAKLRDVSWIKNTPKRQFQSKYKHAKIFGIKGNPSNKTIAAYKKALEDHVRSPDTIVKKGKYHMEDVTFYYNKKAGINLIRDSNGKFKSVWKLSKGQTFHIKDGNLGGGMK